MLRLTCQIVMSCFALIVRPARAFPCSRDVDACIVQGARRAVATEEVKGYATMGGTFKLTFKGHSTDSLSFNAGASIIEVCEEMFYHFFEWNAGAFLFVYIRSYRYKGFVLGRFVFPVSHS